MAANRSSGWWLLWLTLAAVPVAVLAQAQGVKRVDHSYWTNEFDRHFRKYSKHYFGAGFDWQWFKAQAIAESTLNPKAKSPTGARGLMQILPSTYKEIKKNNPHFKDIQSPKWNIAAGIYYDRKLFRRWTEYIKGDERLNFALASYNAGFGATRKAYRRALKRKKDVQSWKQVEAFAPKESRRYVRRIQRLMGINES
jgi:soluble lytic murein transglycosylase-like protein